MTSDTTPALILAEGFAAQVQRWSRQTGADEAAVRAAGRAARLVSMALADGHVCVLLDEVADSLEREIAPERLRELLLQSGITGTPEARGGMPLILDDDGRLYLHRYFDYETRLATSLVQRAATRDEALGPGVKARLQSLFEADGDDPDWQKLAAAMALLRGLTIVSGGPGTGKTTTVVKLLACLLEQNPDCRIALAAPTGKAAARMTEAIRQRDANLPLPPEIEARLPKESFTIHRLLEVTPAAGKFRHHAGNRLPIDALVVDEASMLDLAMATKLFEAVPDHARIILLGDKNQLASVEAGAVFSELSGDTSLSEALRARLADLCDLTAAAIVPAPAPAASGLADCAVWLTRNFRSASNSGIGLLAGEINAGDAAAAIARLRAGADESSLHWIEEGETLLGEVAVQRIQDSYNGYLKALSGDLGDRVAVFRAFDRFRLLCAVRGGLRGVEALNRQVSGWFRRSLEHPLDPGERSEWYPGRPVMVLRNDYVLKLFNGDIGIVLPDDTGALMAYFPDPVAGYRAVPPLRLPEHETAFAMTVHKSQGSEFDSVLVMLPAEHNPGLTRELIYTAITRARRQVALVASEAILGRAIQTATRRHSGLAARLRELPDPAGQ